MVEEAQGEILSFGAAEEYMKSFPPLEALRWSKERISKKIWLKILSLPTEMLDAKKDTNTGEYREVRIISVLSPFVTSFQIFGKKAVIWQPEACVALLIEDKFITQMVKSVFEHLWSTSS